MPIQIYHCVPCDEDLELEVSLSEQVPEAVLCKNGPHLAQWKPQVVNFTVEGGTGAARGAANR